MKTRLSSATFRFRFTFTVVFGLFPPLLAAQQPTFLTPVEMKGQWLRGSIAVAQYENDGMIGINGKGTDEGYKIETVNSSGPAASAGVLPGDLVVALDGMSLKGLQTADIVKPIAHKQEGETVNLTINRNGEAKTIAVKVGLRKHLLANDPQWQNEGKLPPGVAQFIFSGSAMVAVGLSRADQYPNHVFLFVNVYSKDASSFVPDDMKFFVLDGTGQQLRHVSLDEIKYGIQLSVGQSWRGGTYPAPPPPSPQRQYTISGVENGNYTLTNSGGGTTTRSGTSNSTYTVTQQPDYTQLGYSLGLAIRQYRDAKSNQKLLEKAKEATASWEGGYFKGQSPVVAGENRFGQVMYWTGSTRRPQPPYRVVLFFSDAKQQEEHATFAFGSGAERIKQEIANQTGPQTTESKTQTSLTNSDVLAMVKAGIGAEIIVAKIKNSTCSFDTSPAALKQLKDASVPDSVVLTMVQAPKS